MDRGRDIKGRAGQSAQLKGVCDALKKDGFPAAVVLAAFASGVIVMAATLIVMHIIVG